ncbi:MAG: hypothetical protein AAB116_15965 [Candidatus Poribacteria bacterium]
MLAVRGIYRNGKIKLLEPINEIEEAELYIIVVPKNTTKNGDKNAEVIVNESFFMMKLQEENAFANSVLANESEDIWNDL